MLRQALMDGKKYLKQNSFGKIENINYSLDAELLLMHIIGCERIELVTKDNRGMSSDEIRRYKVLLKKRAEGMPVQYLTGKSEFMSLEFIVNKDVLIPRPDTEILAEALISYVKKQERSEVIEIGTGSGCIAVSIAKYCRNAHITAADISTAALETAKQNARLNSVEDRIDFIESDIFSNVANNLKGNVDVVVSNPPYIRTDEISRLGKNVKDYEPITALDGKSDGLYFYRKITESANAFLKDEGLLIFEIGFDQKEDVGKIMVQNGFKDIICLKDLAKHDRVLYSFRNKECKL